mmetsp:Transcript_18400/g.29634  ORF Transcript_18400/g.29634 Transcript_18400/m.29634 type:complete len:483 (+) Transcript_18400:453-1901(+)
MLEKRRMLAKLGSVHGALRAPSRSKRNLQRILPACRAASGYAKSPADNSADDGRTVARVSLNNEALEAWEQKLEPGLADINDRVESALQELELMRPDVPTWGQAIQAVQNIALSKRKHLFRPQLVLLGVAVGSREQSWNFVHDLSPGITAFAAGGELQHLFMFVHDDMMDKAMTRRGHDTVQVAIARSDREWVATQPERPTPMSPETVQYLTTLVGDVLQAKSAALLAQGERMTCLKEGSHTLPSATEVVFAGALRAGAAQFDDILGWTGVERSLKQGHCGTGGSTSSTKPTSASIMTRLLADKASFHSFAAPLIAGLRLGAQRRGVHVESSLESICTDWAIHAGAAFQGLDDVMDLVLDPQVSGKDRLQDFQEGRLSLPLYILRQRASKKEWADIMRISSSEAVMTPSERHALLKLASRYELTQGALDFVDQEIAQAKDALRFSENNFAQENGMDILHEGLDVFLQGLISLSTSLRDNKSL